MSSQTCTTPFFFEFVRPFPLSCLPFHSLPVQSLLFLACFWFFASFSSFLAFDSSIRLRLFFLSFLSIFSSVSSVSSFKHPLPLSFLPSPFPLPRITMVAWSRYTLATHSWRRCNGHYTLKLRHCFIQKYKNDFHWVIFFPNSIWQWQTQLRLLISIFLRLWS